MDNTSGMCVAWAPSVLDQTIFVLRWALGGTLAGERPGGALGAMLRPRPSTFMPDMS